MNARQTVIVMVGVIAAIALGAYSSTDPGCDLNNVRTEPCLRYAAYGPVSSTSQAALFWLTAVGALAVAVVLALSPWARGRR